MTGNFDLNVRFQTVAPSRDIVVVGAGIVGCAVAYELARRGASVEIIDDRGAGMGATQASAGMLAPFNEAPDGGPLLDIALRGLEIYDSFVAQLCDDAAVTLNYRRSGTLEVARTDAGVARLAHTQSVLAARGVDAEWLDRSDLRRREPTLAPSAAALFIPSQGFIGAAELTRTMASAARRHGARLIEHGRVKRIARHGDEMSVVTDRGSLTGDTVVLAAGSWSGQISVEGVDAPLPVTPIRGQLLQLQWSGPPLTRVVWSERCYVVPWDDGTVLVGATVEDAGFDERTTVAGVQELMAAVCDLAPSASAATFVAARAGLRPAAPDHLPIIGRSSALPSLIYATAHYRNGVLLAPLTARVIADLLLDDRIDPMFEQTTPMRFGAF